MSDDDPIHNHPTMQALVISHKRLFVVVGVIAAICIGLGVMLALDHTVLYARPAILQ